jgi:hypothetical protein
MDGVYSRVAFPENYQLVIKLQAPVPMTMTFNGATNLKSVVLVSDDTSGAPYFLQTFRDCDVETVDLTQYSRKLNADMSYCFFQANALKSILGALDLTACTNLNYTFFAGSLMDVEFVPNTIYADIRFNSAYLSDASVQSIIDGLADLTGTTTKTLTLNGVGAKLTDEQRATISAKNWTLAY